jgi:uncharacterized membrane protein YidH (DUF202 family)
MIYWSDSELRQGRDDPRPYHLAGWACVGVAAIAVSAIVTLLILTYLAMHFPELW